MDLPKSSQVTPKIVPDVLEEALAKQAAMRPKKTPAKVLSVPPRIPKVKIGRKNRRKIPK
ncbi:MAG TPA: hypothetical protein VFE58_02775 [Tepidisphaeraceae bacterium]|jgi:hypothetical protein|nr:hypothetical protein [Tepidisphaeraceae bacterium]